MYGTHFGNSQKKKQTDKSLLSYSSPLLSHAYSAPGGESSNFPPPAAVSLAMPAPGASSVDLDVPIEADIFENRARMHESLLSLSDTGHWLLQDGCLIRVHTVPRFEMFTPTGIKDIPINLRSWGSEEICRANCAKLTPTDGGCALCPVLSLGPKKAPSRRRGIPPSLPSFSELFSENIISSAHLGPSVVWC